MLKKGDENKKILNTAGSTLSQCLEKCKLKSQEVGLYTCVGYEGPCIWSNTRLSPQTCPWCLSPSWLGLYTWQETKSWQERNDQTIITLTNEQPLSASLLKWQIMLMCVKCAQGWLHPAWRPCRENAAEATLEPALLFLCPNWQAVLTGAWLTGAHTWSCVCVGNATL